MERLSEALRRVAIARGSTAAWSVGSDRGDRVDLDLTPTDDGTPPCPICGGTGWTGREAAVGDADFGRAIPCACRQDDVDRQRLERLERYSNLGPLRAVTFETTISLGVRPEPRSQALFSQGLAAAQAFANEPKGWLVLTGPSGSGKTHLAAAVANERVRAGHPALFIFVPDFLDHLRGAYAPDAEMSYDALFHQVREAPFLVLDDLGAQASTPWAEEKLFQILNHRFTSRLTTVVTMARTVQQMEPRLQSRLTDPEVSRLCVLAIEAKGLLAVGSVMGLRRFQQMTFDAFRPRRSELTPAQQQGMDAVYRASRTYADHPEGWLVLVGDHGTGKTHLAAAVAHTCQAAGIGVLLLVVPDFLDHLRYTFRPESNTSYDEMFEEVKNIPLLILDDLGSHSTTPWAREKLYQIINYRYNAQLPMVVTTDLSLDELERDEPRIASRLADTRFSVVLGIDAPDYRIDR
ncbi:MAG: ATP-binding protein [Chloroflexi bacterium]|nr:ATP-binding protein [Chloroflexota bacterium]